LMQESKATWKMQFIVPYSRFSVCFIRGSGPLAESPTR
jgi:hypothetical protein